MSVVIAGLVVNIIAAYLTKLLDARLAKISSWWRYRSEIAKRNRLATLESLRADADKQIQLAASEVRCRLRSIAFLVQAIGVGLLLTLFVTFGAPTWLVMPLIALFAIFWYVYIQQDRLADRAYSLLAELHRKGEEGKNKSSA